MRKDNNWDEEVAPEEKQQQAVQIMDTTMDEPLGLGYEVVRRRTLELTGLKAQVEFQGGLIYDHAQHLEALPPSLFEGMDEDLRGVGTLGRCAVWMRLFVRSRVLGLRSGAVKQERAIVTFGAIWRPVLALESWAGRVDAQRATMSQARSKDHRLIHDLLVQNAAMQRELQELRDRVTTLERERYRRGK
ncbi:hypothetical protein Tco_0088256 [Tanacetum coccineum]